MVLRIAVLVLILDQLSKYLVVHVLRLDSVGAINVLPPVLNFRMAWNQGINFGLFASSAEVMRWVLIVVAVVIAVWVWIWVRRNRQERRVELAAGLLIGGALGNVIDRLVYGAVADFLNMSLPGIDNPYSFNIADIAIFVGALGLVFLTGRPAKAP
jgi:signal peptidase II